MNVALSRGRDILAGRLLDAGADAVAARAAESPLHVACDCGDVAIVILDMLERCCVDCDARKWLRLMTLTRVLVVITFKLRAARRSVCERNPTAMLLGICGPFRGEGSLVALLIKLNTNIDGGFGPSWKRDAEATARLLSDATTALDGTAREMLRRHMALHDDVPVNRGGRAWPIFSKLVAARSSPRAEAKAAIASGETSSGVARRRGPVLRTRGAGQKPPATAAIARSRRMQSLLKRV